jgi:hypothetical protein
MVRLPQFNLSFYSYKLHNLYYCCHMTRCQITNFHVLNIIIATNIILRCQIKAIGVNHAHTFNNINIMQLPFLSFNHCTMKNLHPTLKNHKQQRGNTTTMILILYLTLVIVMAAAQKKG